MMSDGSRPWISTLMDLQKIFSLPTLESSWHLPLKLYSRIQRENSPSAKWPSSRSGMTSKLQKRESKSNNLSRMDKLSFSMPGGPCTMRRVPHIRIWLTTWCMVRIGCSKSSELSQELDGKSILLVTLTPMLDSFMKWDLMPCSLEGMKTMRMERGCRIRKKNGSICQVPPVLEATIRSSLTRL